MFQLLVTPETCVQWLSLGQEEARSPERSLGPSLWAQGPKQVGHPLLPHQQGSISRGQLIRCVGRELGGKWESWGVHTASPALVALGL